MNKIFALYKNELIKTSKKVSIIVIMCIMIAGVFAVGGLMKLLEKQYSSSNTYYDSDEYYASEEEWIQGEIDSNTARIKEIDTELASLTESDENYYSLMQEKLTLNESISTDQMMIDYDAYSYQNFLSDAISKISSFTAEIDALNVTPDGYATDDTKAQIDSLNELISQIKGTMDTRDFSAYCDILEGYYQDQEDGKSQITWYTTWYLLDKSGGFDDPDLSSLTQSIASYVSSLEQTVTDKVDYLGYDQAALTPEELQTYQERLQIVNYRLDKGEYVLTPDTSMGSAAASAIYGFGTFMIVVMAIMLAGGAVSQEISSGSIKSLIIAPVKRWKIFTAKFLSLLSVSFVAMLILLLVGSLSYGLFFGFDSVTSYIFISHGNTVSIPYLLYQFLSLMVTYIDIVVFLLFALMLSVITKNTAVSVGLSMGTYFTGNIVTSFMMAYLAAADWQKFIPFYNLGLSSRVFPFSDMMNFTSYMGTTASSYSMLPSVSFSVCYLIVLSFCMFYAALDSFNRRDIK